MSHLGKKYLKKVATCLPLDLSVKGYGEQAIPIFDIDPSYVSDKVSTLEFYGNRAVGEDIPMQEVPQ